MSTKTNAQDTTTYGAGTVVHVSPSTLLLDRNIRDAKPDADLIKSVAAVGVLQPVVAVVTGAGDLRVRYGARRTLAAVEAKAESVPVYVAGVEGTEQADEVLRVITQRDENTHRDGLSTAEEVGVAAQLAAFGLSPAQIAKQARMKRAHVDTALAVAGSDLATKATERYADLTLDQAAAVAEFEDDPETVKALVVAASEGQFEHVAQRARQDRDRAQRFAQARADLTEAGVRVLDEAPAYDATTKRLSGLTASAESTDRLSVTEHAECPGHVAWVREGWETVGPDGQPVQWPEEPGENASDEEWEAYETAYEQVRETARQERAVVAEYGCEDPDGNGHHDPYTHTGTYGAAAKPKAADMSEEDRAAARAARALVVENNRAWEAAETVRREWVAAHVAKAKTPPKGTARFVAAALCSDAVLIGTVSGNGQAAEWLGKDHHGYGYADLSPAKSASDNRCQVLALVQVLGDYEADLTRDSWRRDGEHNATGRYLRFLQATGYTLSEVEEYAISSQTA